ncbi:hypothetical protein [Granulicella paludicola]|uniref:hypothetical protein n=1 Tax=Granulicella paludicola TaxID=474951 RepID=UPI0021DFFA76|nr:hypothetical protein [Granulicella paludicola]
MIPERLQRPMPKPPRVHWGFILALQIMTLGLFQMVWLLVLSNWSRRVNGMSRAFWWSLINICMLPALFLFAVIETLVGVPANSPVMAAALLIFRLGILVTALGSLFILRSELESSPISIPLGGVATFFLGVIYFQYHLYDYDVETKTVPEGSLGLAG